jgi:hypothetical protein
MRLQTALAIILPFFACSQQQPAANTNQQQLNAGKNPYKTIGDIPVPQGFQRRSADRLSFVEWTRALPLKEDRTVYLYNGSPKSNQSAQFAVIDMPVGKKDLQQCADAVMRVRAEYLYHRQRYTEIDFMDNNHKHYVFSKTTAGRAALEQYLENVFAHCGTISLSSQLYHLPLRNMQPGDVFIKAGSPGHAMLVADVAQDKEGRKVYLLAQSYMPAQDMHVVVNPSDRSLSPWYTADSSFPIQTPEWTFRPNQLKTWPCNR